MIVVVFSQTAAESQWVKGEINIAFDEQKVIIPYRIDSTPFYGQNRVILQQKHWIDAYPDYQTKFSDLVNAVWNALGRTTTPASDIVCQSPTKESEKKTSIKRIILSAVILILIVLSCGILFLLCENTDYSYNNNGIKVSNIKGLTESQKSALSELFDNMVLIDGGSFTMGNNYEYASYLTSLDSLSVNPHTVTLDPYYISKYETTQKIWKEFAPLADCYIELGENKAIDKISWEEAKAFADTLSSLTGLKFSLPTEAQWEYAAGGAKSNNRLPFSGFEDGIHHYAWIKADNLTSAADVGQKLANEIRLFDMTGNVSEWCEDDFSPYTTDSISNPLSIARNSKKIYRGGDYRTPNMMDMKITTRYFAVPFAKREGTGVRLVINI